MENLKLYETIATTIPTFEYIDGIAYEINVNTESVELSLNRNGTLTIESVDKIKLSTDIISELMILLEKRLNKEVYNNKMNWYYEAN